MRDTLSLPFWGSLPSAAEESPDNSRSAGLRWGRVWAVAAVMMIAFYQIDHDAEQFAGLQVKDHTENNIKNDYIDSIEGGSSKRKIVVLVYGFGGLLGLALCKERKWNVQVAPAMLLGAFLLWGAASVFWSISPGLTLRRLMVLSIMLIGSLGYARSLRPNELLGVALVTFGCFVGYSLLLDIGSGGRPWQSDYRFGGTLHPNVQAAYCGMLCLAAYAFPAGFASRQLTRGLMAFGFVMLYATQSRTSALAVLIGVLMVFMVKLKPRVRYLSAAVLISLAALTTIVYSSQSEGGRKRLNSAVLLGRTDGVGTLSGRIPLWEELSEQAAERWLNGYGYECFWTPDRIDAVARSQGWALQSAHNGYFEVMLQLGWIGLLLALACLAGSVNLFQSAYAKTGQVGYAFGYGMMAFAIANSFLESHFAKLKYPTMIAVIGVLGVVLFFPTESRDDEQAEQGDSVLGSPRPLSSRPSRPRRALTGGRRRA